jgi:energy-coupling factor transport system ATP-binding protein
MRKHLVLRQRRVRDWRQQQPIGTQALSVAHGRTIAVREVTLDLAAGRVTALMGRNGAGKSSLIWALQGSGTRRSGSVAVDGRDPAALKPAGRRSLVGLLPQEASDLLYLETVADECAAADAGADAEPGTCRGLLDRLAPGVDDAIHPRDLSEGQRLALALSIVLAARPPVVLLDEPTRGLDYAGKAELARIVADLAADDHAVLLATHDVEFAAHVADDVVVMADGEIVSQGTPRRVLAESPSFAPQVTKVLGPPWLVVEEVAAALARAGAGHA